MGTSDLALVILAAGEGRRLGAPKALVRLRAARPGSPLEWLLEAGASLDPDPPLIVAGRDAAAIEAALPTRAEVLENPRWREGRTGGVQLAVRARPGRDLCLAPVDVPLVEAEVFQALAREWVRCGRPARGWLAPWVRSGAAQRFGHPVIVGRALLERLEGFSPDRPLRELRALASPLLALEVASASVLDDLDDPEDLARLRERLERPGRGSHC